MSVTCFFCDNNFDYNDGGSRPTRTDYKCGRCGHICLTEECADDFNGERFSQNDKRIISITLRIDYERRNHKPLTKPLILEDLHYIVKQYSHLDPLVKMDDALIKIERATKFVGAKININYGFDFPYYHCFEPQELISILMLLCKEGLIEATDRDNPQNNLSISTAGYRRLREIMKTGRDSRQCFVAMWFTPEMDVVYRDAIKPAIEFKEKGESLPRFKAVKIDNVEHVNDINDEIIAQIRRSRFLVCDLTGYRGGVYFEAGFAYGLGLEVIYTCRNDWCKEEILKDKNGKKVTTLYDNCGNDIQIKKEGVHFDLAHRNRIEWSPDDLDNFRIRLQNRIRAVIV